MFAYCDAAFGSDGNYASRTGVLIMCCGAPVLSKSNKQHVVTKSCCEAELVALCDGVTAVMGCRIYLSNIGIDLVTSTIYEDNKSVLEMVKSDDPFSLRTRNMNIKFFSKQFVDNNDIIIRLCRTDATIADLLTKPLIGRLFRTLRDILMSEPSTECDR